MNIDKKKLREAIHEVERRLKSGYRPQWPSSTFLGDRNDKVAMAIWSKKRDVEMAEFFKDRDRSEPLWATRLYSLMAASRGRLHMTKEWVPTYGSDGGLRLEVRDATHQEKLIAPIRDEFMLVEIAEPVLATG